MKYGSTLIYSCANVITIPVVKGFANYLYSLFTSGILHRYNAFTALAKLATGGASISIGGSTHAFRFLSRYSGDCHYLSDRYIGLG